MSPITTIKVLSQSQYRRFPLSRSFEIVQTTIRAQFNIPISHALVVSYTNSAGQTTKITGEQDFTLAVYDIESNNSVHDALILNISTVEDVFAKKPLLPEIIKISNEELNEILYRAHDITDSLPLKIAAEIVHEIRTASNPRIKLQELLDAHHFAQAQVMPVVFSEDLYKAFASVEKKDMSTFTLRVPTNEIKTQTVKNSTSIGIQSVEQLCVDATTQTEQSAFRTTTRPANTPVCVMVESSTQAGCSSQTSRPTNTVGSTVQELPSESEEIKIARPRRSIKSINSFMTPGRITVSKRQPTEVCSIMYGSKPIIKVQARRSMTEMSSFMTPGRIVSTRRTPQVIASFMWANKVEPRVVKRSPSEICSLMMGVAPVIKIKAARSTTMLSSFMTPNRISVARRSPKEMSSVMYANKPAVRTVKRSVAPLNSFMTVGRTIVKRTTAQINSFVPLACEDLEATIVGNTSFDLSESMINWTTYGVQSTQSYQDALNSFNEEDFELVEANDVLLL